MPHSFLVIFSSLPSCFMYFPVSPYLNISTHYITPCIFHITYILLSVRFQTSEESIQHIKVDLLFRFSQRRSIPVTGFSWHTPPSTLSSSSGLGLPFPPYDLSYIIKSFLLLFTLGIVDCNTCFSFLPFSPASLYMVQPRVM